jgi:uncharacterized Zn-finger protein
VFNTSSDLNKHVRTHTGERPYPCPEDGCGKSFKQLGDLNRHKRTHTGEKPFVCNIGGCNNSFTRLNNYKKHVKVQHGQTVDRPVGGPYVCPHPGCHTTFDREAAMQKHAATHDKSSLIDTYRDHIVGSQHVHKQSQRRKMADDDTDALRMLQRASQKARHM